MMVRRGIDLGQGADPADPASDFKALRLPVQAPAGS